MLGNKTGGCGVVKEGKGNEKMRKLANVHSDMARSIC